MNKAKTFKALQHLCFCVAMTFPIHSFSQITPEPSKDHASLLESHDPVLAANKKLVYDMYREVLEAGQVSRIPHYFVENYIQHNPNVEQGRAALEAFIAGSRPARAVDSEIKLPLISIVAERDIVMINFIRPEEDAEGNIYYTTWFDVFRIENGKIAEHWDPALKDPDALKFNPNTQRL